MTILGFYFDIVRALEEIDAPYMLMGAFAGSGYGISRAPFDIDMIVALREPDEVLDVGYITASANRFGEDVGGLWRMILERVETEIASRK